MANDNLKNYMARCEKMTLQRREKTKEREALLKPLESVNRYQTPVGVTQLIWLFSRNRARFLNNQLNISFPNFRLEMWLLNQKMHRRTQRQHIQILLIEQQKKQRKTSQLGTMTFRRFSRIKRQLELHK